MAGPRMGAKSPWALDRAAAGPGAKGPLIWPKIYTTTGFGLRKNREMAGVDHLVVYMKTAVKYCGLYIHHPGATPAISLFCLGPNPVVVYIFGVPH